MENKREFYKNLWNEHANSDNMFIQTGRSSYTLLEYFIMLEGINQALQVGREDVLLDVGGATGYMSMFFSSFVKQIVVFDFAEDMVRKAKNLVEPFGNIAVYQDDILEMHNIPKQEYSKVVVGSVLQYLENLEQVKVAMQNIYKVMKSGGKAVLTQNPDLKKKERHILSYERLDWSRERINESLELEEARLWLDMDIVKRLAEEIGFSKCYEWPINERLWHATHMFDFVLEK